MALCLSAIDCEQYKKPPTDVAAFNRLDELPLLRSCHAVRRENTFGAIGQCRRSHPAARECARAEFVE